MLSALIDRTKFAYRAAGILRHRPAGGAHAAGQSHARPVVRAVRFDQPHDHGGDAAIRLTPPAAKRCSNRSITRDVVSRRDRRAIVKSLQDIYRLDTRPKRTNMRSKSFGERIADVLIEDGLLLPNQLEEAVEHAEEGGRPVAQDFDGQTIRH